MFILGGYSQWTWTIRVHSKLVNLFVFNEGVRTLENVLTKTRCLHYVIATPRGRLIYWVIMAIINERLCDVWWMRYFGRLNMTYRDKFVPRTLFHDIARKFIFDNEVTFHWSRERLKLCCKVVLKRLFANWVIVGYIVNV